MFPCTQEHLNSSFFKCAKGFQNIQSPLRLSQGNVKAPTRGWDIENVVSIICPPPAPSKDFKTAEWSLCCITRNSENPLFFFKQSVSHLNNFTPSIMFSCRTSKIHHNVRERTEAKRGVTVVRQSVAIAIIL
jgi:hypothetical protein